MQQETHYTLSTRHLTICTFHYTLHNIHFSPYTSQYTLLTIHFTIYTSHHTLHSIHFIIGMSSVKHNAVLFLEVGRQTLIETKQSQGSSYSAHSCGVRTSAGPRSTFCLPALQMPAANVDCWSGPRSICLGSALPA